MPSDIVTTTTNPQITFAMIKADAIDNGVQGNIIHALRQAGFTVLAMRNTVVVENDDELIEKFYDDHVDKAYFPDLKAGMRKSVPLILEYTGPAWPEPDNAVSYLRTFIGSTDSRKADIHTIRGLFGGHLFDENAPMAANAIHASDSYENVVRDIQLMFPSTFVFNDASGTAVVVSQLHVTKDIPHVQGISY